MTFGEIIREQKKFFDSVEGLFKSGVKSIFEEVPELEVLKWSQSTPSYNDGEPCEFSVSYLEFFLTGEYSSESDEDDDDEVEGFCSYSIERQEGLSEKSKALLTAFNKEFNELDDVLKNIFGDGKEITIKRDGTVMVEDYEGDY